MAVEAGTKRLTATSMMKMMTKQRLTTERRYAFRRSSGTALVASSRGVCSVATASSAWALPAARLMRVSLAMPTRCCGRRRLRVNERGRLWNAEEVHWICQRTRRGVFTKVAMVLFKSCYRHDPGLSEVLNAGLHGLLGSTWRIMMEETSDFCRPNSELRSKRHVMLVSHSCKKPNRCSRQAVAVLYNAAGMTAFPSAAAAFKTCNSMNHPSPKTHGWSAHADVLPPTPKTLPSRWAGNR